MEAYITMVSTAESEVREHANWERERGNRARVYRRCVRAGGCYMDVWVLVIVGQRQTIPLQGDER